MKTRSRLDEGVQLHCLTPIQIAGLSTVLEICLYSKKNPVLYHQRMVVFDGGSRKVCCDSCQVAS